MAAQPKGAKASHGKGVSRIAKGRTHVYGGAEHGDDFLHQAWLGFGLAWALSIHKSQGMTLPLVDVSLSGVFARGQAYVALSRAVSLERIRVRGFQPSAVKEIGRASCRERVCELV